MLKERLKKKPEQGIAVVVAANHKGKHDLLGLLRLLSIGIYVVVGVLLMCIGYDVYGVHPKEGGHSMVVKAPTISHGDVKNRTSPPPKPALENTGKELPHWVSSSILNLTKQLREDRNSIQQYKKDAGKAQAAIQRLQESNAGVKSELAELTITNDQLRQRLSEAQMAKQATQSSYLPPKQPGGVDTSNGIIALRAATKKSPKPKVDSQKGPSSNVKDWMVIAVHAGHAVVQTPAGQVEMVRVGSDVDGDKVTAIDASKHSVQLNNSSWIYLPK